MQKARIDTVQSARQEVFAGRNWGLAGLLILWCCGCSGVLPSTKRQDQSLQTAQAITTSQQLTIEKAIAIDPPPEVIWQSIPAPEPPAASPWGSGSSTNKASGPFPAPVSPAYHAQVRVTSMTGQQSGTSEIAAGKASETIPFGVKLILAGCGLLAISAGLWTLWRILRTSAVGQAIKTADVFLKSRIDALRQKITSGEVKTSEELAKINSEIAAHEAERGKLASGQS